MRRAIKLFGVLLLVARPAWATEAPLTLPDALRMAAQRNPQVLASQEREASARSLEAAAGAAKLPSVSLQAKPGYTQGGTSGVGLSGSLSASWLLWDGDAAETAMAIASQQSEIANAQTRQGALDVKLATGLAFLAVLRAEGLQAVSDESMSQAEDHLRLGQARLRSGTGTRAEVLQLEALFAAAQGNALQSRQAVRSARLQLSSLLNLPLGDRPLATPSLPVRPTPTADEAKKALEDRPEVMAQRWRMSLDRLRSRAESLGTSPAVSLSASLQDSANALPASVGSLSGFAGLSATWPLYEGGRARLRSESAEHDLAADQAQLLGLLLVGDQEIQDAVQTRELAQARVPIAKRARTAAQEAYRIARERYALGLATSLELNDVQATLLAAENNEVGAGIDLTTAELKLERSLGDPEAAMRRLKPTD